MSITLFSSSFPQLPPSNPNFKLECAGRAPGSPVDYHPLAIADATISPAVRPSPPPPAKTHHAFTSALGVRYRRYLCPVAGLESAARLIEKEHSFGIYSKRRRATTDDG